MRQFKSGRIVKNIQHNQFSIVEKHGEYDFGSYKRGYLFAKEKKLLKDCEELIFCNDSCYAPLFDFCDLFNTMSVTSLDFWGNTMCKKDFYNKYNPHIQSYFIVFKSNVFNSEIFNQFMYSIKKEKYKNDVITNYEVGLSSLLSKENLFLIFKFLNIY